MNDPNLPHNIDKYMPLKNRNVVLGVTGSIAAYKAADIASKLVQSGAEVDVILTENATKFVGPPTFEGITHRPITTNLWGSNSPLKIDHVALASRANCVLIAPATANTLAKLALGLSDDPLGTTVLATKAPIIVAPAMDGDMWTSAATQNNVRNLKKQGVVFCGPEFGRMASGIISTGRLEDPSRIVGIVRKTIGMSGDFSGRKVVISAGGTREPIDPIRYLSNRSTGKMGYALAEAARDRGADVTLIKASSTLETPAGISLLSAETVEEMKQIVFQECENADLLVMAAAISDFRPQNISVDKIKKSGNNFSLHLVENEDWMRFVEGPKLIKVAFAAETGDAAEKAKCKVKSKGAVFTVANDVMAKGSGFGSDTNKIWIVDELENVEEFPIMDKLSVAHIILDKARQKLKY